MTSQWPLIMTSQWVMTLLCMPIVKSHLGNDVAWDIHCYVILSNDLLCVHIMASQCIMTLL